MLLEAFNCFKANNLFVILEKLIILTY